MFFVVAWLRLLLLLFTISPLAAARDETLFTSSVTYCEPPETLLIQQFDITYVAKNTSIVFNISAASVESNVNVTANLFVNVYGAHPFNTTIDLCHLLNGALCPLPKYNFTGSDSIQLPSSLGITSKIPGIAYKIPDLEAFAQLTLIEVGTGKVKACVQATLSNGWSARQPAVEWATGGLALGGLASALWQSVSPEALLPFRLLELLYLYQTIATSGLLKLNYPSVYRSFTLNFAWALGLISSANSPIQHSINNMRHLTGGKMADASSGSAVGLVNRKLSPYNFAVAQSLLNAAKTLMKIDLADSTPALKGRGESPFGHIQQLDATAGQVVTVTSASSNVLDAGVPIFVNSLHIATANAFTTVFLITLIILAIAIGFFGLGYLTLLAFKRKEWAEDFRESYPSFVRSWILRIALVLLMPGLLFTFFQWTLKDSWLSVLLSVIFFVIVPGFVIYTSFITLRLARSSPDSLFSHTDFLSSHGPLYAQYRTPRYFFFIPLVLAALAKSLVIAFAKGHGEAQAIAIVVIELLVLGATVTMRPFKTKGGDVLSTFLAIVRLVASGLSVAFAERIALRAIPRVVIGIIIAVLFSIAVIVMFINLLLHSGILRLFKRSSSRPSLRSQGSADENMLEKGDAGPSDSLPHLGRPINPTPEQNIRLDPAIIKIYPDVTPAPTIPATPTTAETLQSVSAYSQMSNVTSSYGSALSGRVSLSDLPATPSSVAESEDSGSVTLTTRYTGSSHVH